MINKPISIVLAFFLIAVLIQESALAGRKEWNIVALRAASPVTIDGVIDIEWKGTNEVYINPDGKQRTEKGATLEPSDFSGKLMAMWDEKYFYAAFSVADDIPFVAGGTFRNDDMGLYFDTKNDGGASPKDDDTMIHLPFIGKGVGINAGEYKTWLRYFGATKNDAMIEAEGAELGWKEAEVDIKGKKLQGMVLEVAIPFEPNLHGLKPSEGKTIGFAWHIYDTDVKIDDVEDVFRWPEDLGWIPPDNFGTLTFTLKTASVDAKEKLVSIWGRIKAQN